jgi:hypothetical protein
MSLNPVASDIPENQKNPDESASVAIVRMGLEKLSGGVMKGLLDGIEKTATIAQRGVIPFLLAMGAVLMFFCLALKIEVHKDAPFATLSTGQFVTVFVIAGILILAGTGFRVWTYTSEYILRKDELRVRLRIVEATSGLTEKGLIASSQIAAANTKLAEAQLTASVETTRTALNTSTHVQNETNQMQ